MSIELQMEREEDMLRKALEESRITKLEYNTAMRDLYRDYSAMAKQSADEAHRAELERWY